MRKWETVEPVPESDGHAALDEVGRGLGCGALLPLDVHACILPGRRRTIGAHGERESMVTFIVRRWRRRVVFRAWARGELEYAGAVGWRSELQRSL